MNSVWYGYSNRYWQLRQLLKEGKIISPHSAAVNSQGNVYFVAWITGLRAVKLERCGLDATAPVKP